MKFAKNISYIHIILLILITVGCNQKKDVYENSKKIFVNNYKLTSIKEKIIYLDSLTVPSKSSIILFNKNGKRTVYVLSYLEWSLQTYDWNSGKLLTKVLLQREGPDGVGKPQGMFVISSDSICLISPYDFKLSIVNADGKVTKRYLLTEKNNTKATLGTGVQAICDFSNVAEFVNGNLYINANPFDDYKMESYYSLGKVGLILNIRSGSIQYLTNMPSVFKKLYNDGYSLSAQQTAFSQSYSADNNSIVINFPTENDLFEISLSDKKVTTHYAGSQYFNEIEYGTKKRVDINEEYGYFAKQPYFSTIFYDSFRKVYLRILAMPNPERIDPNDGNIDILPFLPYLIILDKSFKKIGEFKLEADTWKSGIITTKEGIYLPKRSNDENKLMYTLYSLEKI